MKVTIVTPVFNGMPWLPDAVNSVADQRRDVDLEHLVYDGGSTDGSVEWLREHTSLGYEAIFGPDEGQSDALAKGFDRAKGDLLGWINADDLLEPGALRRVVEVFASDPELAIVTGACLRIDSNGAIISATPVPPEPTREGLLDLPDVLAQPATFFSAAAYRRTEGLDRRYDLAMDLDLWYKLARVGAIKPLPDEILARFRVHPMAKSTARAAATARQDLRIRRRHGVPLRSRSVITMFNIGYVRPVVRRCTSPFRWVARRLLLSGRTRDKSARS